MEKKYEITSILTQNVTKFLVSISFVFVFFVYAQAAQAASLYFSPSTGSYEIGATFPVDVYVSSEDQTMNAASGIVSFPKDKIEITSLSKAVSIISLWVQEPSFSNSAGTSDFEGIILNPGFTGSSGKIITLTFKTKAAGTAPVRFSSGAVLANDGKGTNILASLGDAQFNVRSAVSQQPSGAPKAETPVETVNTLPAPEISSPTHPDPNKWYAASNAKFTWVFPSDATGARLLVGRIPNAIPTVTYTSPINSREVTGLADGVWYFHVRFRNRGGWGGVSHFRFQIDTEKPSSFDIQEIKRTDVTDPKVMFEFDAEDETSGISHYEVQIDDGSPRAWEDDGSGVFETSVLGSGKHTLIAKTFDKAGNFAINSVEFNINALEPPTIVDYPKKLLSGEFLIVKGTTYPNVQVVVWSQKDKDDPKSQIIKSSDKGDFTFVAEEKLKDGIYKMWGEVVDERGARSLPSEKITIAIEQPAIIKATSQAVDVLKIVISFLVLIFVLLFIVFYGWHKFSLFRKKLKKEVREAESVLHNAFDLLKENIRDQIKVLEKTKTKRQLTHEEEKVITQLQKDLDNAEGLVKKEIEDIEKELT